MLLDCSCILSFESFGDPEVQDQTPDSCTVYCIVKYLVSSTCLYTPLFNTFH